MKTVYAIVYQKVIHPSLPDYVDINTIKDVNDAMEADQLKTVSTIYADSLDDAYFQMQAENWSPKGEAGDLIRSLGLNHTSMMVGDIIFRFEGPDNNIKAWKVASVGFEELK